MEKNVKFDKNYWNVSKFSNGWNSCNIKKLNTDEIEPSDETTLNKVKFYYTKNNNLKMVNITHKQKHCKEESIDQRFNALNFGTQKVCWCQHVYGCHGSNSHSLDIQYVDKIG